MRGFPVREYGAPSAAQRGPKENGRRHKAKEQLHGKGDHKGNPSAKRIAFADLVTWGGMEG